MIITVFSLTPSDFAIMAVSVSESALGFKSVSGAKIWPKFGCRARRRRGLRESAEDRRLGNDVK